MDGLQVIGFHASKVIILIERSCPNLIPTRTGPRPPVCSRMVAILVEIGGRPSCTIVSVLCVCEHWTDIFPVIIAILTVLNDLYDIVCVLWPKCVAGAIVPQVAAWTCAADFLFTLETSVPTLELSVARHFHCFERDVQSAQIAPEARRAPRAREAQKEWMGGTARKNLTSLYGGRCAIRAASAGKERSLVSSCVIWVIYTRQAAPPSEDNRSS